MSFSRREAGKLALASIPGLSLVNSSRASADSAPAARALAQGRAGRGIKRPGFSSVFGGVQVGLIAPYSLPGIGTNPEDLLKAIVDLQISAVELQSDGFEAYLGAPQPPVPGAPAGRGTAPGAAPPTPAPAGVRSAAPPASTATTGQATTSTAGTPAAPAAAGNGRQARPLTPEQLATQAREALRRWRIAAPVEKFKALRTMYNDAGVDIQIVKFALGDTMSDEEMDYCFDAAGWLGARAITCEPPLSQARRVALFAEKHKVRVGFHGHADITSVEAFGRPGAWEQAFFYSPYNGANVDIGHFTAGNGTSARDFIRRYHERITNIHLKDRKINQGPNMPWGEGDTPIREILQMLKREKYQFMATIELEYPVPDGSSMRAEVARCLAYCKDALA